MKSAKRKFDNICVFNEVTPDYFLFRTDELDAPDVHETSVIYNAFQIFGIPDSLSDTEMHEAFDGEKKDMKKIGTIHGCLILCEEMTLQGEDPHLVCDDLDGDLEYMLHELEEEGTIDISDGLSGERIYYIHEFLLEDEFNKDLELEKFVISKLPDFVYTLLHVRPEVLSYIYPLPGLLEDPNNGLVDSDTSTEKSTTSVFYQYKKHGFREVGTSRVVYKDLR